MRYFITGFAVLIATLIIAPLGMYAQEYSDSGDVVYFPTSLETVELPNGMIAVESKTSGYVLAADTESPFHLVAQTCSGTSLLDADNNLLRASGYCAGRDRDGDMYWMSYWNDEDGGEWTLLGGSGKFEGLSGGGTSHSIAQDAVGSFVVRWSGTWRLP